MTKNAEIVNACNCVFKTESPRTLETDLLFAISAAILDAAKMVAFRAAAHAKRAEAPITTKPTFPAMIWAASANTCPLYIDICAGVRRSMAAVLTRM